MKKILTFLVVVAIIALGAGSIDGHHKAVYDTTSSTSAASLIEEPMNGIVPFIAFINSAKQSLDVNTYLLTDYTIINALCADEKRGVNVRVLLSARVYGDAGEYSREAADLQKCGITVKPSHGFAYDHAKYMVVDNTKALLGSANATYSAYRYNLEFDVQVDGSTASELANLFNADWRYVSAPPVPQLIVSPGSEPALAEIISQPGKVYITSEEMSDWQIVDAIEHKGHFAHLILPASLSSYDKSIVDGIERYGVQVRYVSSPYIHAKAIAGNSMCFIGSENFTATSLNHNREVGLSFSGAICAKLRADIKEL